MTFGFFHTTTHSLSFTTTATIGDLDMGHITGRVVWWQRWRDDRVVSISWRVESILEVVTL
jgi:hypothetical protein